MNLLFNIFKTIIGGNKKDLPVPEFAPEVKKTTTRKISEKKRVITKTLQIKNHLIEKGSIDSWTAIELYGATRLSAIIFNLRAEGLNITSTPNTAFDRNNNICNFTTYEYINNNGVN
jgi:hypothetical protein